MRTLVSAPAIAIASPSIADVALPEPNVLELERAVLAAWKRLEFTLAAKNTAEKAMFKWRERNPQPEMRKCHVGTNEQYLEFEAGRSSYDPNGDLKAAMKEHSDAMKAWNARRDVAARNCGLTSADGQEEKHADEFTNALGPFTEPFTNIADVMVKARVARLSDDSELYESVVDDLLRLGNTMIVRSLELPHPRSGITVGRACDADCNSYEFGARQDGGVCFAFEKQEDDLKLSVTPPASLKEAVRRMMLA